MARPSVPGHRPQAGLGWVRRPRTWRGSPAPWVPGGSGGEAVRGCGGSASGPITECIMRISSWVGGRWHDSKWASTPRPPPAAGRVWRHRVQRHTGQQFPTSHHLVGLPSGPSTAGSRGSNLPVAISKRNSGVRSDWSMGRNGRGPEVGPGSPPRRHTRAAARPAGGLDSYLRETPGWAPLLDRHGHMGAGE